MNTSGQMNKYKRSLCLGAVSPCSCIWEELGLRTFHCFFQGPDLGVGNSASNPGSPWECVRHSPFAWPLPRGGGDYSVSIKQLPEMRSGESSAAIGWMMDGMWQLHFRCFPWVWSGCQINNIPFLSFQRIGWISWPNFCPLGIILPRKKCLGICLQKPSAPGNNVVLSVSRNLPFIFLSV